MGKLARLKVNVCFASERSWRLSYRNSQDSCALASKVLLNKITYIEKHCRRPAIWRMYKLDARLAKDTITNQISAHPQRTTICYRSSAAGSDITSAHKEHALVTFSLREQGGEKTTAQCLAFEELIF